MQAATAKFRIEADPLRAYLDERVASAHGQRVARQEIYQDYVAWAVNNGFQALSTARFYESLAHILAELIPSAEYRRTKAGRFIAGIRLTHAN